MRKRARQRSTPTIRNTPSIILIISLSMLAHRSRIGLSMTSNNIPLARVPARGRIGPTMTRRVIVSPAVVVTRGRGTTTGGGSDVVAYSTAHLGSSSGTSRVRSSPPPRSDIMKRLRGGGGGGGGGGSSDHRPPGDASSHDDREWRKAYIAVGSNLGDRYRNVVDALSALVSDGTVRVLRTSYLRTTPPMYVTDQPQFLNGAIEVVTCLDPMDLLRYLKGIEAGLGRDVGSNDNGGTVRFGPRTIDLDILLYDDDTCEGKIENDDDGDDKTTTIMTRRSSLVMRNDVLEIPHPRMCEREFVLSPMRDLETTSSRKKEKDTINDIEDDGDDEIIIRHPVHNVSMSRLLESLMKENRSIIGEGRDEGKNYNVRNEDRGTRAVRVLPLPRGRMLQFNGTIIMGILNVTPDSFSDGGMHADSVENAAMHAMQMVKDGADVIDVGGESTRPGASDVSEEMEMERVIPVIRRIRELGIDVPISIDTRRSSVARAAIMAGADVINDVSGGTHDPTMLGIVASLGVPMIIMHMRGTPRTMSSLSNYDEYPGGVVSGVGHELNRRSIEAEAAGVHRWLQVIDPGIGFAKDYDGNLSLLGNIDALRRYCGGLPLLIGPSRKRFIGEITGESHPMDRDYGTVAACLASILHGDDDGAGNIGDAPCNILRVHNVKAVKQAILVYDAIRNARRR
jgi:dihydropteroate synthase/2-amino-4-hydroxy-6-hydroxymethyldihydropteridine diphosphokinase